jgi:hypothetical protein
MTKTPAVDHLLALLGLGLNVLGSYRDCFLAETKIRDHIRTQPDEPLPPDLQVYLEKVENASII